METATVPPPKRPKGARQLLGGPPRPVLPCCALSPHRPGPGRRRDPPASLPRRRPRHLRPQESPGGGLGARRGKGVGWGRDTRARRASPTCGGATRSQPTGRTCRRSPRWGGDTRSPLPGAVARGLFQRARGGRGSAPSSHPRPLLRARARTRTHTCTQGRARTRRSPSLSRSLAEPGLAASRRSRWRALLPSACRHWLAGVS